jgi:two-component system phosphate regulon response regulator PhoB
MEKKMSKARILIVDDEEDILELLRYNISKEGYDVISAENGEGCLKLAHSHTPDLIILDLMMPDIDGLDVCKRLKKEDETKSIPVIMLTAKDTESDIIVGLELGADDYIAKPFSPKVLVARMKSVLRRSRGDESESGDEVIKRSGLSVDTSGREVKFDGAKIDLTYSEFEIILLLIKNPGRVFSRKQIMTAARGDDYLVTERAMDVQIVNLRKKLGEAGELIKTVRGVGYKFNG